MIKINKENLLINNGITKKNSKNRKILLETLQTVFEISNPDNIIRSKIKLIKNNLIINKKSYNLSQFKRIRVVGAGKAVANMAQNIEKILGDKITDGVIIIPDYLEKPALNKIKIMYGTHPFPSQNSINGTKEIMKLLKSSNDDDLILNILSGGGSSLLSLPAKGVTIEDKIETSNLLMKSGATIHDLNVVRKHISDIKGGLLAKWAYPARIVSIIISDVVGDQIDIIASGPTAPDSSTFQDSINILKKFNVWNKISYNIKNRLTKGIEGKIDETSKFDDKCFKKVDNLIIFTNRDVCNAVVNKLQQYMETKLLTSFIEGEASVVGSLIGSIVLEAKSHMDNKKSGLAYVFGGETSVTVKNNGKGGRNLELCLGASKKIKDHDGIVVASIATDGVDGVTDAAGGICDGGTMQRGLDKRMEIGDYLKRNDSYNFLQKLDDLIITGPTGTNLNDIIIVIMS